MCEWRQMMVGQVAGDGGSNSARAGTMGVASGRRRGGVIVVVGGSELLMGSADTPKPRARRLQQAGAVHVGPTKESQEQLVGERLITIVAITTAI